jgi:hypothetical protein
MRGQFSTAGCRRGLPPEAAPRPPAASRDRHRHRATPPPGAVIHRVRALHPRDSCVAPYGADVTLSKLEDAFVHLVGAHGLPFPRTNIDVCGDKVDCHWPGLGLTIELLSYGFHASRESFENDITRRRRSNHVAFSYGDVVDRGRTTAVELRELLERVGGPAA